jgi:GNAT superfamily N-acetyltransferase
LTDPIRVCELGLPATGFDAFTYPRYRELLSGGAQPEAARERLAVAAWAGEVPAGLAFLSRESPEHDRQLLSIMVSPALRRRGLGERLLLAVQDLAAGRGTSRLVARFSSRMAAARAFEALLAKAGWSAPEAFEYRLAGRASWALEALRDWAPFLDRLRKTGFSAADWRTLTGRERTEISAVMDRHMTGAERAFDPFRDEAKLALIPEICVLLRRDAEIVGWIQGKRGGLPDTFHYSSGYVIPPLRRAGWLIGGAREVCQRQAERFGGDTVAVFEAAADNLAMRRFMDRQLKRYSTWTDTRYRSEKRLAQAFTPQSDRG